MRPLVRAVAALLVLLGSFLVASPGHAAAAPTTFVIAFVVDGGPATAGDAVFFDATLTTDGNAPVAGRQVTLLTRVAGSGDPFKVAATLVTDEEGYAHTELKLLRNTAYRWHFAGDPAYRAASSNTLVDPVGSKVVPHLSDSTPGVYQPFAAYGRAYPNKAGSRVSLWAGTYQLGFGPPGSARMLAVGRVRADGTFRVVGQLTRPGTKKLFVRVAADDENADGYSKYLTVTVG